MSIIYGIDIGSNSVRLFKSEDGVTQFKKTQTTQLSEGLLDSGVLKQSAMDKTITAVIDFVGQVKQAGSIPFIFATEAVRKAANGKIFTAEIKRQSGIEVDVISGELEATLGYIGAGGYTRDKTTVIDIGGASTEIVSGYNKDIKHLKSVSLGVVLLKDKCGQDEKLLNCFIDTRLTNYSEVNAIGNIYAIGGTATSIAAIDLSMTVYDALKIDGHIISASRLKDISQMLLKLELEQIKKVPGVQEKRADVIAGGALLMYKLVKMLNKDKIIVSESDNLEGYAAYNKLYESK